METTTLPRETEVETRNTYFIFVSPGEGAVPEYSGFVTCTEAELQDYQAMLLRVARETGVPCAYMTRVENVMLTDRGFLRWGPVTQESGGYMEQDLRGTMASKVTHWTGIGLIA
jgi:hypothetical protein